MSKRFGRTKRREQARKIEWLSHANQELRIQVANATAERDRARAETRAVVQAVEEIAPFCAAIEPRLAQLADFTDTIRVTMYGDRNAGSLGGPIGAEEVILSRLFVGAVRDEVKKAAICYARIGPPEGGHGFAVYLSLKALRADRARKLVIQIVAEKLVDALAKVAPS